MRAQTTGTILTCWTLTFAAPAFAGSEQTTATPSARAMLFFEALGTADASGALGAVRPPAVDADTRRRVLSLLPRDGGFQPDAKEAAKLASLGAVLSFHDRRQVFETKLIDVPQAFVGILERAVLMVSRNALRLLSTEEFQALVAHEVGHEYFWDASQRAEAGGDRQMLQEIELKCDGIAVLTLVSLGIDPASLDSGVQKLTRFNQRLGATSNSGNYPPPGERRQFARIIAARSVASR